ncbi:carboxymuconolactone decarboxylase family protein [Paenibacillus ferrarius]|uniref:carboxymuconolactone decarboxylase family protein n=1 Tax=Paenibacillus ferrarius TaxID=1469647 RepID=UPI003D27E81D
MSHYYSREDLAAIPDLVKLAPQAATSFFTFEKEIYHTGGAVPLKTKELIAIAAAHVTGCPYCIDTHVQRYRALGGTPEEIMEAVLVAASTRAGAVLSHATQALTAFQRAEHKSGHDKTPECFC